MAIFNQNFKYLWNCCTRRFYPSKTTGGFGNVFEQIKAIIICNLSTLLRTWTAQLKIYMEFRIVGKRLNKRNLQPSDLRIKNSKSYTRNLQVLCAKCANKCHGGALVRTCCGQGAELYVQNVNLVPSVYTLHRAIRSKMLSWTYYLYTVRWSNFDRWNPKMGVFLQGTEGTPCGHHLKWKLTPENPPADTMFMAAMAMVSLWKIVKDFQSFVKKKYKTLTLIFKICILQENGFEKLTLVMFER